MLEMSVGKTWGRRHMEVFYKPAEPSKYYNKAVASGHMARRLITMTHAPENVTPFSLRPTGVRKTWLSRGLGLVASSCRS